MTLLSKTCIAIAFSTLTLVGCEPPNPQTPKDLTMNQRPEPAATGREKFAGISAAKADIAATTESDIRGSVSFTPSDGGKAMKINISLAGLSPGAHGFHIHTNPDCGDAGKAAGGHFNPSEQPHAGPEAQAQHAGDLGNIEADSNGQVDTVLKTDQLAFSGNNNILNRAVVIHAGKDDLQSQPSGAAGDRVGCGVIRQQQDVLALHR